MTVRSIDNSAPLPTLDSIINGVQDNGEPSPITEKQPEAKQENDSGTLERIEREQKFRREQFAAQKRIKELEAKLRDSSNQASKIDPNSKNPIKDLAKARNLSQDDVVRLALEAMDDDASPDEKKADLAKSSPEEIAKLVKEQLEKERSAENAKQQGEKAIADFKAKISDQIKSSVDKYPLVEALNASESVFSLIESKYTKDLEEFGEEYAVEKMMTIEEAIKTSNETLAQNIKTALQSKHLKDFILKIIKEDGRQDENLDQSEDFDQLEETDITLNNKAHRASTEPAGKPKFGSDDEEMEFLIKQYL